MSLSIRNHITGCTLYKNIRNHSKAYNTGCPRISGITVKVFNTEFPRISDALILCVLELLQIKLIPALIWRRRAAKLPTAYIQVRIRGACGHGPPSWPFKGGPLKLLERKTRFSESVLQDIKPQTIGARRVRSNCR